ncbi:hypothetical protein SMACR_06295 [Sordaria macrospora]|uniref:WGS project CABT00000000 data, contig 2.34 n=2 Tax=Sordaria macrospora TaxID=5147 RepID=F7W6D8_SORMK|nr:uncharacterized protein SMAC_06295 [Sordaria macrospora k-hell]KAA8635214.1 hypothetical protein SMACR_06295 [Sordaria macrospora]KAH7630427.1 hypothetical protein B0T09DRAFT_148438 [Sordaria sp. MPI-SDFR-AT-0083]WPJ67094.1 hypothetical protein SMAC4_06295 [Sordaria macrospora]CCC13077.1 unnamed protein product [Sordaria macrospora k-hell]
MKAALLPLAAMFAVAAAQTTSVCQAAYIVENCLGSENAKLSVCNRDDYGCKCAQYANIITCFNNCPNDVRKASVMGERDTWCALDKQYPSSTSKVVAATTTAAGLNTAVAAQPTDAGSDNENTDDAANTTAGNAASSNTDSAPSSSATGNAAGEVLVNAGGLLAAVAGVVAAVL